jgi:hypothetical protein
VEDMKKLISLLLAFAGCSAAATQNAVIKGVVTDEVGHPENGVVVTANLLPPVAAGAAIPASFVFFSANALSAANGSFEIDGLPAGTFSLCAEKQGSQLLNPCIWGTPTKVAVASGATENGTAVKVQNGVTIVVRVADPKGTLAGNPQADDILIGTGYRKSPFVRARTITKDGTGRTLTLTVPPGLALNVSVTSRALQLADGGGQLLAPGAALPVVAATLAAGAVQVIDPVNAIPDVVVNITGLKQANP